MGILAGGPAAEELLAGRVVLQVEGVGLARATLRLPALDRHAAGDEVHRAPPPSEQDVQEDLMILSNATGMRLAMKYIVRSPLQDRIFKKRSREPVRWRLCIERSIAR
jgi:hypothetical protein